MFFIWVCVQGQCDIGKILCVVWNIEFCCKQFVVYFFEDGGIIGQGQVVGIIERLFVSSVKIN